MELRRQNEVCLTPQCVKVAAGVISALDEAVDPCEDFYLFASASPLLPLRQLKIGRAHV